MPAAAVAALVISLSAVTTDNGAAAAADVEHDFKVRWPAGTPRGVVVFLHGVSSDPFRPSEEGEGIEALAVAATKRGLVAVFPIGYQVCDFEKPREYQRCWLIDQIDDEMKDLTKIVRTLEKKAGVPFQKRQLIGFSNGGFLVAGALQRGLLDDFTRVGILSAGPVGDRVPAPEKPLPKVFIEVGKDDKWQRGSTRQLASMLTSTTVFDESIHFREVPGGHVFDRERASRFLDWFWSDG